MSYEHRSSVQSRGVPRAVKILSFVIVIVLLLDVVFPKFLPIVFTKIISPFWNIEKAVKGGNDFVNSDLGNAIFSELQKENSDLKNILHRNASSSPMILAYIVKKPPFSVYDSYIIDIGENNVQIGNKVYALGNILLGEVVEINGSLAKVKLYSSYGEKYEVFLGKTNIQATATGNGGGSFEVVLPKDVKVFVNDVVSVPNLNVSVFGIVKSVTVDPARSFSTILFSQPINIYEQKWVQVIPTSAKK